jgi:hypothetical protein
MASTSANASPVANPGMRGPVLVRTAGPAPDRSPATAGPARTIRSWPLLVLAVPAAAEVWSGWVGIAQKTGFGLVAPLPGIWPSLHLNTAITLPVGVEAYAAYALRAWLASESHTSPRTRRFAKWSAIISFALGMAGQIAYHLLAQAGMTRAPWPITMIVSCLPVLVLGMGTTLAHMLRADTTPGGPGIQTSKPAIVWSSTPPADQPTGDQDQPTDEEPGGPPDRSTTLPARQPDGRAGVIWPGPEGTRAVMENARLIARKLAAAGRPVSRRALRGAGAQGSNELLGAVVRTLNAELADRGTRPQ